MKINYKFYTPSVDKIKGDVTTLSANNRDELVRTAFLERDGRKIVEDIIKRKTPGVDNRGIYFHPTLKVIGIVIVPGDGDVNNFANYLTILNDIPSVDVEGIIDSALNDSNNKVTKKVKSIVTEITDEISRSLTAVMTYKGTVANKDALPDTDVKTGDTYNVEDTGDNYAWDGRKWDKLSGTVDLSGYATKTEVQETQQALLGTATNATKALEEVNKKANITADNIDVNIWRKKLNVSDTVNDEIVSGIMLNSISLDDNKTDSIDEVKNKVNEVGAVLKKGIYFININTTSGKSVMKKLTVGDTNEIEKMENAKKLPFFIELYDSFRSDPESDQRFKEVIKFNKSVHEYGKSVIFNKEGDIYVYSGGGPKRVIPYNIKQLQEIYINDVYNLKHLPSFVYGGGKRYLLVNEAQASAGIDIRYNARNCYVKDNKFYVKEMKEIKNAFGDSSLEDVEKKLTTKGNLIIIEDIKKLRDDSEVNKAAIQMSADTLYYCETDKTLYINKGISFVPVFKQTEDEGNGVILPD